MVSNCFFQTANAFPMLRMPYRENMSGMQGIKKPSVVEMTSRFKVPRLGDVSMITKS